MSYMLRPLLGFNQLKHRLLLQPSLNNVVFESKHSDGNYKLVRGDVRLMAKTTENTPSPNQPKLGVAKKKEKKKQDKNSMNNVVFESKHSDGNSKLVRGDVRLMAETTEPTASPNQPKLGISQPKKKKKQDKNSIPDDDDDNNNNPAGASLEQYPTGENSLDISSPSNENLISDNNNNNNNNNNPVEFDYDK